jgi:hypothetical protein
MSWNYFSPTPGKYGIARKSWWMRWPRERLTLATLVVSLAFWAVVLPAIGVI